jgi:hypothetical protein
MYLNRLSVYVQSFLSLLESGTMMGKELASKKPDLFGCSMSLTSQIYEVTLVSFASILEMEKSSPFRTDTRRFDYF